MVEKIQTEMCRNCKFFMQHYILDNGKFKWINAGHCMKLRLRNKQAYSKICEHYEYQEPVEDRYVNKEYLSKELLQKVLTMDLLPKMDIRKVIHKLHDLFPLRLPRRYAPRNDNEG